MNNNPPEQMPDQKETNWKTPIYLGGAVLGLIVGFIAAHLYTQSVEENHGETARPQIETVDMLKLGMAGITLMRQITDIGAKAQSRR